MASTLLNDSYVSFWPKSNVNFVKVSTDVNVSLTDALASRSVLGGADTLCSLYSTGRVDALYFPPEIQSGSNIIYTIYRKTPDQNYYEYVFTLDTGDYTLYDYKIKSDHYYHYMMTIENSSDNGKANKKYISYDVYENFDDESGESNYFGTHFSNWTICNIEETDTEGIYTKSGKMWELGLNMSGENVTKNLNINSIDTLSRYPKIMIGNRNYDSMQFSGFLGRINEYTKYSYTGDSNADAQTAKTVIEYTEKSDGYNSKKDTYTVNDLYATESDKLEAWKEFINDGELKLIKDMKGNMWIGQICDSTEYEINNISNFMLTTITFSWKEVMDVSKISIIVSGE